MIATFVAIAEIMQVEGDIALLQIAAVAQFLGDVSRDVLGPSFSAIKSDHELCIARSTGL